MIFLLSHTACSSSFYEAAVIHNSVIETEAAREIVGSITVSSNSGGNITSKAALAHDINRFFFWNFIQTFPQVSTGIFTNPSTCPLWYSPGFWYLISNASVMRQIFDIFYVELLQGTVRNIFYHKSSQIYRVFGRGIGRCIGQIQLCQVLGFHTCM